MEALQTEGSPQIGNGFPQAIPERTINYNPSPALPEHMLQQHAKGFGGTDNAVSSLMYAVLNQRRDVDTKFHMLLVPESAAPSMHVFDTVDDLRLAVRSHLGTSTYVFCYLGHALRITKGPFHFLQTPYGSIPLNEIPSPTDQGALLNGWVGPELPITEYVRPPVDDPHDELSVFNAELDEEEAAAMDEEIPHDETELF